MMMEYVLTVFCVVIVGLLVDLTRGVRRIHSVLTAPKPEAPAPKVVTPAVPAVFPQPAGLRGSAERRRIQAGLPPVKES